MPQFIPVLTQDHPFDECGEQEGCNHWTLHRTDLLLTVQNLWVNLEANERGLILRVSTAWRGPADPDWVQAFVPWDEGEIIIEAEGNEEEEMEAENGTRIDRTRD